MFYKMPTFLLPWMVMFMKVIMAMPFLTLLERKVMGYMQSRKGPNKVSYLGLLQPMSDGGKLMFKELGTPNFANISLFWLSPVLSLLLMIISWSLFPSYYQKYKFKLGIMFFLCISSLQVYTLLGSGWGSKSKYALLGSVRGAAQTISYEVSLIIMMFTPCCLESNYKFMNYLYNSFPYMLMLWPLFMVWLMSCLAETNRAPFDFAEGESELVSGFKMEYSAFEFACLFLSEYGKMLLMSFMSALLFFSGSYFMYLILGLMMTFTFVWMRSALPRFRYDFLMDLAWKIFLPLSLFFIFFMILI